MLSLGPKLNGCNLLILIVLLCSRGYLNSYLGTDPGQSRARSLGGKTSCTGCSTWCFAKTTVGCGVGTRRATSRRCASSRCPCCARIPSTPSAALTAGVKRLTATPDTVRLCSGYSPAGKCDCPALQVTIHPDHESPSCFQGLVVALPVGRLVLGWLWSHSIIHLDSLPRFN